MNFLYSNKKSSDGSPSEQHFSSIFLEKVTTFDSESLNIRFLEFNYQELFVLHQRQTASKKGRPMVCKTVFTHQSYTHQDREMQKVIFLCQNPRLTSLGSTPIPTALLLQLYCVVAYVKMEQENVIKNASALTLQIVK